MDIPRAMMWEREGKWEHSLNKDKCPTERQIRVHTFFGLGCPLMLMTWWVNLGGGRSSGHSSQLEAGTVFQWWQPESIKEMTHMAYGKVHSLTYDLNSLGENPVASCGIMDTVWQEPADRLDLFLELPRSGSVSLANILNYWEPMVSPYLKNENNKSILSGLW